MIEGTCINQGIPLVTVFQGISVRDKSNIRLHDLSRASVTSAEGRERMLTKIVKYPTVAQIISGFENELFLPSVLN